MKIFVTGGTGFIGRNLVNRLVEEGHQVTVLTRKIRSSSENVEFIEGDPVKPGKWQNSVAEHNVIINLAGASIFKRWSKSYMKKIYDSRILTTRNLVNALDAQGRTVFLNASAVGYYGFQDDEVITEQNPAGDDFLARVTADWENEALKAKEYGIRVVLCRFGIVIGEGGAMGKILPLFRYHLGSVLGTGKQWFSWIHIDDLVRIFLFLLDNSEIEGALNCTSPYPVRNREMTRIIGEVMNKRVFLPAIPEFILRLALGEFAGLVVKGQRVLPQKLLDYGFKFKFPTFREALEDVLKAKNKK